VYAIVAYIRHLVLIRRIAKTPKAFVQHTLKLAALQSDTLRGGASCFCRRRSIARFSLRRNGRQRRPRLLVVARAIALAFTGLSCGSTGILISETKTRDGSG